MRKFMLLAIAAIGLGGPVVSAADLDGQPTVFFDNLDAFPDVRFYVYLLGSKLDRDSTPFAARWTLVRAGQPLAYPAARNRLREETAVLFAVPRSLQQEGETEPRAAWFTGATPEVRKVGEVPVRYIRDDMGGQTARILHHRLERQGEDWSLVLVSERDEYNWRQRIPFLLFAYSPFIVLGLVVLIGWGVWRFWPRQKAEAG